jgi:hypothetical protein
MKIVYTLDSRKKINFLGHYLYLRLTLVTYQLSIYKPLLLMAIPGKKIALRQSHFLSHHSKPLVTGDWTRRRAGIKAESTDSLATDQGHGLIW